MSEEKAQQRGPIKRRMTMKINVDEHAELAKVGRNLAAFLKTVDHEHGPFDIDVAIAVTPLTAGDLAEALMADLQEGDKKPLTFVLMSEGYGDDILPEGAD